MEVQTTQTVHVKKPTQPETLHPRHVIKLFTVMVAAVLFLSITVLEFNAELRAGGGRSMGGRSSCSYSRPAPNPI